MKKQYTYAIYRIGSNSFNQSMCNRAIVFAVDATSNQAAIDSAHRLVQEMLASQFRGENYTLYANQYLEAIPWSKVPKADKLELAEMEAMTGLKLFNCNSYIMEKI